MFTHHLTTRAGFGLSYIGGILTTNFDIFFKENLLWECIIKKRVAVTNVEKYRKSLKMIAL
ncbi:hypothetical protein IK9_05970 [Bacillus cereus VD166]|nr:hypothetical protein IK9_05970 [Bacillus cereus VD166]